MNLWFYIFRVFHSIAIIALKLSRLWPTVALQAGSYVLRQASIELSSLLHFLLHTCASLSPKSPSSSYRGIVFRGPSLHTRHVTFKCVIMVSRNFSGLLENMHFVKRKSEFILTFPILI